MSSDSTDSTYAELGLFALLHAARYDGKNSEEKRRGVENTRLVSTVMRDDANDPLMIAGYFAVGSDIARLPFNFSFGRYFCTRAASLVDVGLSTGSAALYGRVFFYLSILSYLRAKGLISEGQFAASVAYSLDIRIYSGVAGLHLPFFKRWGNFAELTIKTSTLEFEHQEAMLADLRETQRLMHAPIASAERMIAQRPHRQQRRAA